MLVLNHTILARGTLLVTSTKTTRSELRIFNGF